MLNLLPPALWITLAATAPSAPGPTLASEDTLSTQVPEVLVSAPRVTLDEILDRVARGEARRDSMIADEAFTATFRLVRPATGKKPAGIIVETVSRTYKKRPDKIRTLLLRERKEKPDKEHVNIDFRADMSEEIVNFAFRPENRHAFRFRIAGRDIVGNHLIYRLAFEPRSPLDPTQPGGLVWVDTNEFVILRQEVNFSRSPLPLFIKKFDRMVVERQKVGNTWVLARVLMRAQLTMPVPKLGQSFDISLLFDQYAINSGLPDSIFTGKEAAR